MGLLVVHHYVLPPNDQVCLTVYDEVSDTLISVPTKHTAVSDVTLLSLIQNEELPSLLQYVTLDGHISQDTPKLSTVQSRANLASRLTTVITVKGTKFVPVPSYFDLNKAKALVLQDIGKAINDNDKTTYTQGNVRNRLMFLTGQKECQLYFQEEKCHGHSDVHVLSSGEISRDEFRNKLTTWTSDDGHGLTFLRIDRRCRWATEKVLNTCMRLPRDVSLHSLEKILGKCDGRGGTLVMSRKRRVFVRFFDPDGEDDENGDSRSNKPTRGGLENCLSSCFAFSHRLRTICMNPKAAMKSCYIVPVLKRCLVACHRDIAVLSDAICKVVNDFTNANENYVTPSSTQCHAYVQYDFSKFYPNILMSLLKLAVAYLKASYLSCRKRKRDCDSDLSCFSTAPFEELVGGLLLDATDGHKGVLVSLTGNLKYVDGSFGHKLLSAVRTFGAYILETSITAVQAFLGNDTVLVHKCVDSFTFGVPFQLANLPAVAEVDAVVARAVQAKLGCEWSCRLKEDFRCTHMAIWNVNKYVCFNKGNPNDRLVKEVGIYNVLQSSLVKAVVFLVTMYRENFVQCNRESAKQLVMKAVFSVVSGDEDAANVFARERATGTVMAAACHKDDSAYEYAIMYAMSDAHIKGGCIHVPKRYLDREDVSKNWSSCNSVGCAAHIPAFSLLHNVQLCRNLNIQPVNLPASVVKRISDASAYLPLFPGNFIPVTVTIPFAENVGGHDDVENTRNVLKKEMEKKKNTFKGCSEEDVFTVLDYISDETLEDLVNLVVTFQKSGLRHGFW